MPVAQLGTGVEAPTLKPILIIGGGIAGLTTSRLLTNSGIPNLVFEASGHDRSQGFSVSLRDWGYSALLDALGGIPLRSLTRNVAPDRQVGGHGYVDLMIRDNRTGEVLVAPEPAAQPTVVRANRNALRTWIADCGDDEIDVRHAHVLKRAWGQRGNVTVEFENGARHHGSLVVAADGVFSAVRSQVLPHAVPELVPAVVYHGEFQLPRADFDSRLRPLMGDSNILAGVGDGFNTPITVCNATQAQVHLDWSYSRPARAGADPLYRPDSTTREADEIPQALLDELAALKLAEPWSHFLAPDAVREHSVFHWKSRCVSITKQDATQAAAQGVVFVGDSWHAMPIFGGEGGCHAIVDAVELSSAIARHSGDLEGAVATYYNDAWKRCQDAVKRSKGRFYVLHRPMAEWREIAEKRALGKVA